MSYRLDFGPEHVQDLDASIDDNHEKFLASDDPETRSDLLRCMAVYAVEYLHLVPHNKKFKLQATQRVLHQSAMNISDFDPRESSLSFDWLARYAYNLLDQPWRRDFLTINLASGFFVHNIAAQLQNAHEILIEMGYVNIDENTMKLSTTNIDKLKAASRDCFVASQECLILSQIWQRVADKEPEYPVTTGEIFEFRKQYVGNTDSICQQFLADISQRDQRSRHFVPVEPLISIDDDDSDASFNRRNKCDSRSEANPLDRSRDHKHIYDTVSAEQPGRNDLMSPLPYSVGETCKFIQSQNSAFESFTPRHDLHPHPQLYKTDPENFNLPSSNPPPLLLQYGRRSSEWTAPPPRGPIAQSYTEKYSYRPSGRLNQNGFETDREKDSIATSTEYPHASKNYPKERYPEKMKHRASITGVTKPSFQETYRSSSITDYSHSPPPDSNDVLHEALEYENEVKQLKATHTHNLPRYDHESLQPYSNSNGLSARKSVSSSQWQPCVSKPNNNINRVKSRYSECGLSSQSLESVDRKNSKHDVLDILCKEELEQYSNSRVAKSSPHRVSEISSNNGMNRQSISHSHGRSETNAKSSSSRTSKSQDLGDVYFDTLLQKDDPPKTWKKKETYFGDNGAVTSSFNKLDVPVGSDNYSKTEPDKKLPVKNIEIEPWNCGHCTYRNTTQERICEVCCKSRDYKDSSPDYLTGATEETLVPKLYSTVVSDGERNNNRPKPVSCPSCTFINEANQILCKMCENRLRMPPSDHIFFHRSE